VISILLTGYILLQGKEKYFNQSSHGRLELGRSVSNFTFPGLNGKMFSLADYRGKVVFLNIWATWCPPCRDEMPSMERLYQELKDEDFIILAVSVDSSGAKAVAPFVRNYQLTFPVLLDDKGKSRSLFKTTGIPESHIINKEGILVEKTIGPRDWDNPDTIQFLRELIHKPRT
jgi:thiol-disulfide isomerase/thioredoxin